MLRRHPRMGTNQLLINTLLLIRLAPLGTTACRSHSGRIAPDPTPCGVWSQSDKH